MDLVGTSKEKDGEMSQAFLEMRTWFDELPAEERAAILSLRPDIGKGRLLPESHGDGMEAQVEAGKKRFLEMKDPFCLVRVSDCEIGLIGGGHIPARAPNDLPWQFRTAGFSRSAFHLRKDFIAAIREANLVGLQENWPDVRTNTAILFSMLGLPLPLPNAVEVHLIYGLLADGTLFRYLAGKKVLLVGGTAWPFYERLRRPEFLAAFSFLGPIGEMKVAGVISTRTREEGGAWVDYDRIMEESSKIDFDVALLSCGITAKPVAWKMWKRGRTALDVGFVMDALTGNAERYQRPILMNVKWPKPW